MLALLGPYTTPEKSLVLHENFFFNLPHSYLFLTLKYDIVDITQFRYTLTEPGPSLTTLDKFSHLGTINNKRLTGISLATYFKIVLSSKQFHSSCNINIDKCSKKRHYPLSIQPHFCIQKVKICVITMALTLLILICGDVHVNPGPPYIGVTHTLGSINVASWNVRTLLNDTCRNQRRTAIIGRELARYNIDIAALSETRISGVDQETVEHGAGYTFFTTGKPDGEPRTHGVGFAIKNTLLSKLGDQKPYGINCRLSHMKIKLNQNRVANLISAYAPTLDSPDEQKDEFYEDLSTLLCGIPTNQKIILLGDFNARVGTDYNTWRKVIGKHGIGVANANGNRLLSLCAEHKFVITNTVFQQCNKYKATWMHPRSKRWHLLDYIIVRQSDLSDIKLTRAVIPTTIWSDHRLVRSKLTLKVSPQIRATRGAIRKKLNVQALKTDTVRNKLVRQLTEKLTETTCNANPSSEWEQLRDVTLKTAETVLGYTVSKSRDWFDEQDKEINPLLNKVHQNHDSWVEDSSNIQKEIQYRISRQQAQRSIRQMKDKWWTDRAKEMQIAADKHDTKTFYQELKKVHGPKKRSTASIKDKTGNILLSDKKEILNRWAEHFNSVLNQISDFDDSVLDELPDFEVNEHLSSLPTQAETDFAIKQMASDKAAGSDSIPAEVYKHGGDLLKKRLRDLFVLIWEHRHLPQQLKDALIVHIYKRKGDISCCDNHRGISLLSIAGKILARIVLNRLQKHIEERNVIPESQCGFRPKRGTSDMIFSIRQLQEKCRERNLDLYMVFIDLTKAFDTVNREGLWKILKKIGCPDTFVEIIKLFHDDMTAKVMDGGEISPEFVVKNGTKQGCVLAPTLFNIFFSMMLHVAFKNEEECVNIHSRTDKALFSHRFDRYFTLSKKGSYTRIRDLLFADDCALVALTEQGVQQLTNCFSNAAKRFGLTISLKKTEVMRQHKPKAVDKTSPKVNIDGTELKSVTKFTYLGSTISANASIDDEINHRISKGASAFGRLLNRLWLNHDIRLDTKINVYRAAVLTPLLYGCETWTTYRRHVRLLDRFHQRCLRRIAGIRWQQLIPDTKVLKTCQIPGMESFLIKSKLRWTGHVSRMDENRIPKRLLYGTIHDHVNKLGVGRPTMRYKHNLKDSLNKASIPIMEWEKMADARVPWRSTCRTGIESFEINRIGRAEAKRSQRKARLALPPDR